MAEVLVPATAAILFVPKMVGNGVLGSEMSNPGMEMSPPPPTIESKNPAKNEKMIRATMAVIP